MQIFHKNYNNLSQDIKRTIARPFLYHFRPMCTYYWPYQWHIRDTTRGRWVETTLTTFGLSWLDGWGDGCHITRWSESDHWSSAVRCCSTPFISCCEDCCPDWRLETGVWRRAWAGSKLGVPSRPRPNGKCLHLHQSKLWHLTLESLVQSLSSIQFPETMPSPYPASHWVVVLLLNFNYKCNKLSASSQLSSHINELSLT